MALCWARVRTFDVIHPVTTEDTPRVTGITVVLSLPVLSCPVELAPHAAIVRSVLRLDECREVSFDSPTRGQAFVTTAKKILYPRHPASRDDVSRRKSHQARVSEPVSRSLPSIRLQPTHRLPMIPLTSTSTSIRISGHVWCNKRHGVKHTTCIHPTCPVLPQNSKKSAWSADTTPPEESTIEQLNSHSRSSKSPKLASSRHHITSPLVLPM